METRHIGEKHPEKQQSATTTSSSESYSLIWTRKLIAAYGASVPAARLTIYVEALSPFTELQVEEAVTMAIGKCKFFPAVAELLDCVHEATLARHKALAAEQNQKLLDRLDKPATW